MAFQIKDFKSITASMINWMRVSTHKITDYNVGSAARTLIEAPAAELDQLYQEMFHGLKESIPVATYQTFDFDRLAERAATGRLTFYVANGAHDEDIVIAEGTLVASPATGVRYATSAPLLIPRGTSQGSVPAVATATGALTNAASGAVTDLVGNVPGIVGVANQAPFANGRDRESDEERKLRFQAYIATLNRGTLAAIRYGATTTRLLDDRGQLLERVAHVAIIEPYEEDPGNNTPGLVEVYLHNGVGGTSSNLVNQAQLVIDGYYADDGAPIPGWKAAGVIVACYPATEILVNVSATLSLHGGATEGRAAQAAAQAVARYLDGLGVGEEVVRNEIIERIMTVPGVYDVALAHPVDNLPITRSQKAMPGVIGVEVA